jgi:uroporphyrinogen decarboxylase
MRIPTFNLTFYKDPDLIQDMLEYWEYFMIETLRSVVETLKDKVDVIFWWEDMADRHGPCISPKLYREFLLPHYQNVTAFLAKNKIDRILMDSDGNVNPILDLIIEAGITGLWPLEVNAGMNAVEIRKKHGNKLFLIGNLDKAELVKGGVAMRREVDSKLPTLKELGGYIPSADQLIPVEMTLETFKEYAKYIKAILPFK